MCVCVSLSLVIVFLSFDGSETLIKINIIGFALHLTNGFFPQVLWLSHSSPGMFGIGSLLPFPRSDLKQVFCLFVVVVVFFLFLMNSYSACSLSLSLSLSLLPPPKNVHTVCPC